MSKIIILNTKQREKALIELIRDGKELNFNKELIQKYDLQLFEIQKEIKIDKDKADQFNLKIIERGLKC